MSVFDWTIAGTGIVYGRCTISTNAPRRSYDPPNNIQTIIASGDYNGGSGSTAYFDMLNGRFDTPPTGWNGF